MGSGVRGMIAKGVTDLGTGATFAVNLAFLRTEHKKPRTSRRIMEANRKEARGGSSGSTSPGG